MREIAKKKKLFRYKETKVTYWLSFCTLTQSAIIEIFIDAFFIRYAMKLK